ncbi:hypothetical protein Ciccas_009978, partial [Cichlidogyrus casuarinus]
MSEEEKLRTTIEEISILEEQKRDQALHLKQDIIDGLQESLDRARITMTDRSAEYESIIDQLRSQNRELGTKLNEKNANCETVDELKSQIQKLNEEIVTCKKDTEERASLEELKQSDATVREHAQTICLMEERLAKLVKQSKDCKLE